MASSRAHMCDVPFLHMCLHATIFALDLIACTLVMPHRYVDEDAIRNDERQKALDMLHQQGCVCVWKEE